MATTLSHDDLGSLSFTPLAAADLSNPSPAPPLDAGIVTKENGSTITVNTKAPDAAQFPPVKAEKPRPHVCLTCKRSFARLEHLKRHERSHTKEKPFSCDQCARCFARRDLLLRHQQKLHQSTTPAARPRNRRESTAGASARGRKNSMASANGSGAVAASLGLSGMNGANHADGAGMSMRPRANTISHVEATQPVHLLSSTNPSVARGAAPALHSRHPSLAGLPVHGMEQPPLQTSAFGSMSSTMGNRGLNIGLPKLETQGINGLDFSGGLHTAPPHAVFSPDFDFDGPTFGNPSSTINPNALHYTDSPNPLALDPTSVFTQGMGGYNDSRDSFSWLAGLGNQMSLGGPIDENAIDGSSPSAMSTGSQSAISDAMLDGSLNLNGHVAATMAPPTSTTGGLNLSSMAWQPNPLMSTQNTLSNNLSFDLGSSSFSELMGVLPMSPGVSAHTLGLSSAPAGAGLSTAPVHADTYFSTPPSSFSAVSPSILSSINHGAFGTALGLHGGNIPETPSSMNGSNSSSSMNGQHHHTSLNTSSPVSTITDATRSAIINALTPTAYHVSSLGLPKYSLSASSSSFVRTPNPEQSVPSTNDLRKYVSAYLRYFQPHFPFLHVGTLSFEMPANAGPGLASSLNVHGPSANTFGGSGCLILSMAAIGALFELEHEQSKMLFGMAKRMIQLYLDERRKANVRKADFRRTPVNDSQAQQQADTSADTPVWLVQAMLLNVVYGHNGSDKRAGEIASTHCAALVSLAQGAELLQLKRIDPVSDESEMNMSDGVDPSNIWSTDDGTRAAARAAKEEAQWLKWKAMEERKRTLYAIFVLSSLLVSSYNHTPALTNSEITLDLPCDEEFFAAPTCAEFMAKGGIAAANHNRVTFHDALGNLLRASEKQSTGIRTGDELADVKPSTFGCFVLINALHNYIWETRQRHHNKVWTNEETEKMHRHIEPALEAWHRAWKNSPRNTSCTISRLGMDALSADSIPLLDLAYVRLFVNLARSKEKFWQRNWDGLAEELSHGREIVQHAEQSPVSNAESILTDAHSDLSGNTSSVFVDSPATQVSASPDFAGGKFSGTAQQNGQQSSTANSRREKHLRKAALYAVDAMSITDKQGFTLADFGNRELPLQSALCVFDSAQVLAEWVATLQDRVGRYLGILDQDVDFNQVPAIMLLEEEDGKLLGKIKDVLGAAEQTMNMDLDPASNTMTGMTTRVVSRMRMGEQIGYGAKILGITAYTLGKAAVWPVTQLMAECLENHANRMRARAEKSIVACD